MVEPVEAGRAVLIEPSADEITSEEAEAETEEFGEVALEEEKAAEGEVEEANEAWR